MKKSKAKGGTKAAKRGANIIITFSTDDPKTFFNFLERLASAESTEQATKTP